jgi:nitrous oxide reductase accessory protein NosL
MPVTLQEDSSMQRILYIMKIQKRSWVLPSFLGIFLLLTAGCGSNDERTAKEESVQATTSAGEPLVEAKKCAMCGKEISGITTCRISLKDGKELNACCSFCAANIRKRIGSQPFSAVTVCYTTGRKVDFKKAVFVVESDEVPCCTPSVLAFVSMEEAEKFVAEKNGRIIKYPEILDYAVKYKARSK